MEKLPVYSRMCLTRKLRSSCKVGGGTGITAVVSDFVASASVSLSQKHCAKAHCVFCVVIYVMAVAAGGDCSLCYFLEILVWFKSIHPLFLSSEIWIRNTIDSLKIFAGIHHTAERISLLLHTQLALAE